MLDRSELRKPRPIFNGCPICHEAIGTCQHYGKGGHPDPEPVDEFWHTKRLPSMGKLAIMRRARERRIKGGNRKRAFEGRHTGNAKGAKKQ